MGLIMPECKMSKEQIKKMRTKRRLKFAFLQEEKKEND